VHRLRRVGQDARARRAGGAHRVRVARQRPRARQSDGACRAPLVGTDRDRGSARADPRRAVEGRGDGGARRVGQRWGIGQLTRRRRARPGRRRAQSDQLEHLAHGGAARNLAEHSARPHREVRSSGRRGAGAAATARTASGASRRHPAGRSGRSARFAGRRSAV
jgi:hypothetical protein